MGARAISTSRASGLWPNDGLIAQSGGARAASDPVPQTGSVRPGLDHVVMAQNVTDCPGEQAS